MQKIWEQVPCIGVKITESFSTSVVAEDYASNEVEKL